MEYGDYDYIIGFSIFIWRAIGYILLFLLICYAYSRYKDYKQSKRKLPPDVPSKQAENTSNQVFDSSARSFRKGIEGEKMIRQKLRQICEDEYILSNSYFCYKGRSTEIDLIMLTKKFLYVIEVKNYSGVVYGEWNKREWIQSLSGKTYRFFNPAMQNDNHCIALYRFMPYFPVKRIKSVVVFCGSAILKTHANNVIRFENLLSYIAELESQPVADFDNGYRHGVITDISRHLCKDPSLRLEHIEYARNVRERL